MRSVCILDPAPFGASSNFLLFLPIGPVFANRQLQMRTLHQGHGRVAGQQRPVGCRSRERSISSSSRRMVPVRCSVEPNAEQPQPPRPPSWKAQQLYNLLGSSTDTPVGSERGEGFMHYVSAGPLRVDVEALNDHMRPAGALRLRHAQHPHEAFGMVFNFDGVVADLATIRRDAWALLAEQLGLPLPHGILHHPELQVMSPEVAVVRLLRWAPDRKAAIQLAIQHAELAGQLLATHNQPQPGVREWLDTLGRFNVPCALVSALDRQTVQAALARMTLHDHFQCMVTAEDELDTISQRLLTASIKLGRAPNFCVYFDSSPRGITAAHNCTLKAVAVQGAYRPHQLKAADITCGSLTELSVINLRRMFANMGHELMDLQKQASQKKNDNDDDDSDDNKRRRRRIVNAML